MKTYEVTITLATKGAHEAHIIHSHSVSCVGDKTHLTPATPWSAKKLLELGAEVDEHLYSLNTSICTFRPLPEKKLAIAAI